MNYKSRKTTLLLFGMILFLITSFMVSANASDISITDIWYKKLPNYTHLTIKASGPILEYEPFYLEEEGNPKKIVVDIKNAIVNIKEFQENRLELNMGSVDRVRFGQFKSEPIPITRFVVDLFQKANYEVKLSPDKRFLYIDVYDYTEFKAPEEQIFTVTPVKSKSEAVKIEKEEEPKISLIDAVTDSINLNLKETEVLDAIRALSEISGINIVADDSVTGKITLKLSDKSFREALDLILMLKGLDYTVKRDTLIIAKKEVIDKYKEPITRIFELKNARAEAAKGILDSYKTEGSKVNIVADTRTNTLIVIGTNEELERLEGIISTIDKELLTRTFKIDNAIDEADIKAIQNMLSIIIPDAENRIKVDDRQREIIVKGTKEELKKAEELIPKLDKRAQQMSIEIKIIEIDLLSEKNLGITWTSGGNEGEISIGELTLGGTLERFGLVEAKLKALENEDKINILSNPKIHATNGKEAFIFSGEQIPIIKKDPETGEYTMVGREDVGIRMSVTPWISTDGIINLLLRADKSYRGIEVKPGTGIFIIETQQIAYKKQGGEEGQGPAMVIQARPDETVVVGGLIESTERENVYKIPLLGDIPIIGELFTRRSKFNTKTEIIILITAHLLDY